MVPQIYELLARSQLSDTEKERIEGRSKLIQGVDQHVILEPSEQALKLGELQWILSAHLRQNNLIHFVNCFKKLLFHNKPTLCKNKIRVFPYGAQYLKNPEHFSKNESAPQLKPIHFVRLVSAAKTKTA
jgi:hypothetical protein